MAEPTLLPGVNSTVEVQIGGVWYDVPGTADFSASGGEAPETDIRTYAGTGKATGFAGVPTVSIAVPLYVPTHETWVLLRANAGTQLPWRVTSPEATVVGDPGEYDRCGCGGDRSAHGCCGWGGSRLGRFGR